MSIIGLKERMFSMLTSKQRALLRKEAQSLDVVFQVGKGEIDDTLVQSTLECLTARELIKMKVLENSMYSPREAADLLAEKTGADCVQVIGSKFVLFLPKAKESKYADLLKTCKK
jgi:RNA-binding protein